MALTERFLSLSGLRTISLVRQSEAAECGLACLAMIAQYHGYDTDLNVLRRRFPISLKGSTLGNLIEISGQIGLATRAVRCGLNDLARLRLPCIIHWEFNHFVVIRKVRGNRVWILDPAAGKRVAGLGDIAASFTGVALELSPTPSFTRRRDRLPVKLGTLANWTPQIRASLIQGFLLSVLLELFVLLNPFYMQLVIDEAILKSDHDLLVGLASGFVLLTIFNVAAGTLRALVFQFLANVLSFDMEARLFHHLIRLPLEFFHKRTLGDLLQRFHAVEPIKQLIVNGGIAALLDGSLAIFTAAMMLVYSWRLGLIAIIIFLLYAALRFSAISVARRYAADLYVTEAKEQTRFLETLRAIQTIKICHGESRREALWQNLYAAKLNATIKTGNLGIIYQNLNQLLSGLSDVALIYLAAQDVMDGKMTIGIISAFMAYKGQFMGRMSSLMDHAIQYKMLDVQLDRVGDIALTRQEPGMEGASAHADPIQGRIEARDLAFAYAATDRPIVKSLNLVIEPGEFVAITGASGSGKSTLLKILTGLYQPSGGEILVDGKPLKNLGPVRLRAGLGVVMQEDELLAGSIGENIAFFEEPINLEKIRHCARLAAIDDEIMALPMQYNSLVGDMGSALSSGQKQRVMIARALYRDPQILVLDEGTAHLDPICEAKILETLRNLPITRIAVAHGPAIAAAADRIVALQEGTIVDFSLKLEPAAIGQL